MPPQNLVSIDVFYECVVVTGELDAWSTPALVEKVLQLAGPGGSAVDLDLSEVTFMDSRGLHALLELHQLLPTLRIVSVSTQGQRVLRMTNMTDIVSTHPWRGEGERNHAGLRPGSVGTPIT
jgi:anti-anti-sigma factor